MDSHWLSIFTLLNPFYAQTRNLTAPVYTHFIFQLTFVIGLVEKNKGILYCQTKNKLQVS